MDIDPVLVQVREDGIWRLQVWWADGRVETLVDERELLDGEVE